MKSLDWYKEKYPDTAEVEMIGNRIICPAWLTMFFLHKAGVKSKKFRIQKKVLKRELMRALRLGIEANRNDKDYSDKL